MTRRDALADLTACLRHKCPDGVDWDSVIAVANRTLTTPTLALRLRTGGCLDRLPDDVRRFLQAVLARNEERNRRLLAQLDEALACLNAAEIQPLLLKGAAILLAMPAGQRGGRILADLDLMVAPDDFATAAAELAQIGYREIVPSSDPRVPAVLARTTDVATIDLHSEIGGPATLCDFHQMSVGASAVRLDRGSALLPSATSQLMILVMHDQLKGRDYLRGMIDLRHLLDIELLCDRRELDWDQLALQFPNGYARNALKVQLLTARRLLGMTVPDRLCSGILPELQYRRRILQARFPGLMIPLTFLSMLLDAGYHQARRLRHRSGTEAVRDSARRRWLTAPRRESLRRLFSQDEVGKV